MTRRGLHFFETIRVSGSTDSSSRNMAQQGEKKWQGYSDINPITKPAYPANTDSNLVVYKSNTHPLYRCSISTQLKVVSGQNKLIMLQLSDTRTFCGTMPITAEVSGVQ